MANINIGGRLHSTATGNVVAGANEILDDVKGKKQSVINQETDEALAGKQAALVSGTNIKTVNGESILGSGNIQAGDPDAIKYSTQTLTDAQKTQARTNIGAYNKPATGIPATDLASAAQTSLGKADTAYQKPQGGVPKSDLASGVQGSLDLADTAVQAENVGPILPPPETDEFATKTQVTQLEAKVNPIDSAFQELPMLSEFNGTSSVATCSNIVLENEGDELELELFPEANVGNKQYGLAQKNYNLYLRLSATQTTVSVRADDDTWIATGASIGSTKTHYIFKVAFEDGKTNVYVDGTVVATYNGQKKITVNRWGDFNSNFWGGKIGYVKVNGTLYHSINNIPGWSATNVSYDTLNGFLTSEQSEKLVNTEVVGNKTQKIDGNSTATQYPSAKAVNDFAGQASMLAPMIDAGKSELKKLVPLVTFSNSTAETDQIDLQNEGDSIEMELFPGTMTGNQKFALCNRATNQVSIGATQTEIYVRSSDDTWIASGVSLGGTKTHYVLKIAYEGGNINIYIDGTLLTTYTGQKLIRIKYWGLYNSGGDNYWNGKVGYVYINGHKYGSLADVPGWTTSTTSVESEGTIISKAQANKINTLPDLHKDIRIVPATNKVGVYFRVSGDVYGYLEVNHFVNNADSGGINPYCDLWRIGNDGNLYTRSGDTFTAITDTGLLIGSENEFAIRFSAMNDYTGGYHGNEKIVQANGDYILFFVNGQAYTIDELNVLGATDCDTFSYRQKSTLFADYSYGNNSHLKIATHFKDTEIGGGGYKTKNYMQTDLSELSVPSLNVAWAFLGLVCINEDCAEIVSGDDGQEYEASHPTATTLLVESIDKYGYEVRTRKDAMSCVVDSKMLGTNIDAWKNPPTKVDMYDRADDVKYYSYTPATASNPTAFSTGSFFATECSVKWDY